MTETEWLESTDPQAMLAFLLEPRQRSGNYIHGPARPSDRKLRLAACAFLRTVWDQLDATSQRAVEVAERLADGLAGEAERTQFHDTDRPENYPARAACFSGSAGAADETLRRLVVNQHHQPHSLAVNPLSLADCLRDIVGNPFRPLRVEPRTEDVVAALMRSGSVRFDIGTEDSFDLSQAMLTPLVVSITTAAYESRLSDGTLDSEVLAVLSDALEDAGRPTGMICQACDGAKMVVVDTGGVTPWGDPVETAAPCENCDATGKVPHPLLAHLRSPGPHWRGCWVVDLLLGKE
jgi:hypothetical protein